MAGNKVWRIRDAVHNLIEFDEIDSLESRLWRVIQTPHFQCLRRIKRHVSHCPPVCRHYHY